MIHNSLIVSGGSRYLRARKRLRPLSLLCIISPGTNLPGSEGVRRGSRVQVDITDDEAEEDPSGRCHCQGCAGRGHKDAEAHGLTRMFLKRSQRSPPAPPPPLTPGIQDGKLSEYSIHLHQQISAARIVSPNSIQHENTAAAAAACCC